MHPQLKTSLLPVDLGEIPHLVKIHQAAFESDRFSNLMLLGRDPDAFKGLLLKSIETWMEDPNAQLIKAVAEDGDIVGYACWVTEDAPEVKQPTTKPESGLDTAVEQRKLLPQDLGKLMRKDLVARKRELLGNERHMVLQALITDPQWQKMGVGARLVQWGTSKADVEGLSCWAHASPSGYGVYLRAGFEDLGMSEYDLDQYLPENEQGKSEWGVYTFRYMVRRYETGKVQ
ncbi:hypothetical protein LQW54_008875 [Pestalotiopsis sp. IQ-011]